MNAISRLEAILLGAKKFYTGLPCKYGHIAERQLRDGYCCACAKISMQKSKKKRKETGQEQESNRKYREQPRNKKRQKEWRQSHKDYLRVYSVKRYKINREKRCAYMRERYKNKKEIIREQGKRYEKKAILSGQVRIWNHKKRCRRKNADGFHVHDDLVKMMKNQNNKCNECGCEISFGKKNGFHIDHIMPIKLGGSNWPENLQLLCVYCNCSKGSMHPDQWAVYKKANCNRNGQGM